MPGEQTDVRYKTTSVRRAPHFQLWLRRRREMGSYTFCWVAAILILGARAYLPVNYKCGVQPKSRDECGYPGITADECGKTGCCFDDSVPDAIWCYTPWKFEATKCNPSRPKSRLDCGYPGISEKDCTDRGCCFDSAIHRDVRCYLPKTQAREAGPGRR
ncbi:putative gastrointestinal growth factor xP4 [Bufo gargarizans]|uniref:putative gastrointestinal growth factor xP4 n=1 Tax=Bufo gargarizans TaxID=30331 RepID=UPI001CF5E825|nr:putative gastrointestinal growth factor xP4 [Bufo gargarizans]